MKWWVIAKPIGSMIRGIPAPDGILTTTRNERVYIWGAKAGDSKREKEMQAVLRGYNASGDDEGDSDELEGNSLLDALVDWPDFKSFSALAKPSPLPWILGGGAAALALLAKLRK